MPTFPLTISLENGVKAEINAIEGYPDRYIFKLTNSCNDPLYSFVYSIPKAVSGVETIDEPPVGHDGQNAIAAFLNIL